MQMLGKSDAFTMSLDAPDADDPADLAAALARLLADDRGPAARATTGSRSTPTGGIQLRLHADQPRGPRAGCRRSSAGLLDAMRCRDEVIEKHTYLGGRLGISAVAHQNGTIRFGTDPATSVLDVELPAARRRQRLRRRLQLLRVELGGEPDPDDHRQRVARRRPRRPSPALTLGVRSPPCAGRTGRAPGGRGRARRCAAGRGRGRLRALARPLLRRDAARRPPVRGDQGGRRGRRPGDVPRRHPGHRPLRGPLVAARRGCSASSSTGPAPVASARAAPARSRRCRSASTTTNRPSTRTASCRRPLGRVTGARRRRPSISPRRACWLPSSADELRVAASTALPPAQRTVLELRDVQGLSAAEVCELLDCQRGEPAGAAAPRPEQGACRCSSG